MWFNIFMIGIKSPFESHILCSPVLSGSAVTLQTWALAADSSQCAAVGMMSVEAAEEAA
jgi:hypothetical protein